MRENSGSPRRTAIITGAASGIGRAIAVRLAGDGLDVTVVDLPSAAADLETLVTQLTNAGARCSAVAADVSRPQRWRRRWPATSRPTVGST